MVLTREYCSAVKRLNFEIEVIDHWMEGTLCAKSKERFNEEIFKIIWITRSDLTVNDDSSDNVKRNFIMCLANGNNYSLQIDVPAEGFVISFTRDFLDIDDLEVDLAYLSDLSVLFSRSPVINVDEGSAEEINDLVNIMHKEYSNSLTHKMAILRRYFKIFLIYLSRYFEVSLKQVPHTRGMELVRQFMQAVEDNYKDKKMVAEYADLLFVTANYLNEVVKKVTGRSAGCFIRNRVVAEAKRMAISTNTSMKEIAYKLGFEDSAHFSKFFKSTSGNSFSDFKKGRMMLADLNPS